VYGSVPGDSGETVRLQQCDSPSIDSEQPLIPKHTEQADGGFNRDPGHLSYFFPFESEPNLDLIGAFSPESIAEFQEQAGQPFAGSLERKLIELIHIHPMLITEELDQLDRQLGIPVDEREVAFLVDVMAPTSRTSPREAPARRIRVSRSAHQDPRSGRSAAGPAPKNESA
jgi:hypothetical protein